MLSSHRQQISELPMPASASSHKVQFQNDGRKQGCVICAIISILILSQALIPFILWEIGDRYFQVDVKKAEKELFQEWQHLAAKEPMEALLPSADPVAAAEATELKEEEAIHHEHELIAVDSAGHILAKPQVQPQVQPNDVQSGVAQNVPVVGPRVVMEDSAHWMAGLEAMQAAMDKRMQRLHSMHAHHHVIASHAIETGHHGPPTQHHHSLLEDIADLKREMCKDPLHRHHHSCQTVAAVPEEAVPSSDSSSGASSWASKLTAQMAEMEAKSAELHLKAKEHERAHEEHQKVAPAKDPSMRHSKAHQEHEEHRKHLEERTMETKKHLAALNAGLAEAAHKREEWEHSLNERAHAMAKELCDDPARKGGAACAHILEDAAKAEALKLDDGHYHRKPHMHMHVPSVAETKAFAAKAVAEALAEAKGQTDAEEVAKRGAGLTMRAPGIPRAKTNSFMQSRKPVLVEEKDLREAHWVGRIPKVACIMAVPADPRAQARLKYAVENFRSQTYEGSRQLILVHNHNDQAATKLVKMLADGFWVKAVAARMEVPSATAMRYAAWSADDDAELIARWDIDAWHHPQRLAMQVRSLALTGQHASTMKRWTVAGGNGGELEKMSMEQGWEASVVGEKAWMEANWHPLLITEHGALEAHKSDLAVIDMPELSVHTPGNEDRAFLDISSTDFL